MVQVTDMLVAMVMTECMQRIRGKGKAKERVCFMGRATCVVGMGIRPSFVPKARVRAKAKMDTIAKGGKARVCKGDMARQFCATTAEATDTWQGTARL